MNRKYRLRTVVAMATGLLSAWCACERDTSLPAGPPTQPARDLVPLPPHKPEYSFAPGLAEGHPDIIAFMRHFLETCLAGDYGGYRRLVARGTEPESRARFERILHGLRRLRVDEISPVELPDLPQPCYLVVSTAELVRDPKEAVPRAPETRRVAIVVIREENEWRLAPAPPALQPTSGSPASQPDNAPSEPDYPWDEGSDY